MLYHLEVFKPQDCALSKCAEVIYLLRLLFDFDTSVAIIMFCLCRLLGSLPFERHIISWYNVLSGSTMFNINRKDGLSFALSNCNAGPGCFVDTIQPYTSRHRQQKL